MSVLPTHRDVSPGGNGSSSASSSSLNGGSTQIGADDNIDRSSSSGSGSGEKKVPGKLVKDPKTGAAYLEKGVMELDENGQKRQVMLVVEQKSGKEMFKEVGGGQYTQPRW